MRRYTAKLRTSELPALATAGPAADAPLPAAAPSPALAAPMVGAPEVAPAAARVAGALPRGGGCPGASPPPPPPPPPPVIAAAAPSVTPRLGAPAMSAEA